MQIRITSILIFFFLVNTNIVYSSPGKITTKLINDSPSLLDFGIYKLENEFKDRLRSAVEMFHSNDKFLKISYSYVLINYKYDLDQIHVNTFFDPEIESFIDKNKGSLKGLIILTEEFYKVIDPTLDFSHNGFEVKKYKVPSQDFKKYVQENVVHNYYLAANFTTAYKKVPLATVKNKNLTFYEFSLDKDYYQK